MTRSEFTQKIKNFLVKTREILKRNKVKIILGICIFIPALLVIIAIAFITNYLSTTPQIIHTYPETEQAWDDYLRPVEIEFNVPVLANKFEAKITPRIEGDWVWEPFLGFANLTQRGKFYPKETLYPNQRVVFYIIGVSRLFKEEDHELPLTITTGSESEVASTIPSEGEKDVQKDNGIVINLNKKNNFNSEFVFSFKPEVEFEVSNLFSDKIEIKPKTGFTQNTEYELKIQRRPIRYNFVETEIIEFTDYTYESKLIFNTTKEPLIENFEPQGNGVRDDAVIKVEFEVPMNKESVEANFLIEPEVEGAFEWQGEEDKIFTFKPVKLNKDTNYKVTFTKGIKSTVDGSTEKDLTFEFKTLGPVTVTSVSPADNSSWVAESTVISITFDQEVDKESAQSKFSISPSVAGFFSWEGNTMHFHPENWLSYITTYTVNIDSGIKSIYGLDGTSTFASRFTTRANEISIGGIPQMYQPYGSFSCNIYSALMLLAWKGHYPGASNLIAEIGYNENQSNGQWTGNPYKEFVGNADGSWGYGVYWDPIKSVFANRGIYTEVVHGWSIQGMAYKLLEGHPIIIWRHNGESSFYNKDWVAADGTYVYAINGQHGSVVIGFRGSPDNPTEFLINDPWYGQMWYSAYYLDLYWSWMNRTALIVY